MITFNIPYKIFFILLCVFLTNNLFCQIDSMVDSISIDITKIQRLNKKKYKFELKITNRTQKDLFIELPDSNRDKTTNWNLIYTDKLIISLKVKDSMFKFFKPENYLYDTIIINSCIPNSPLIYKLKYKKYFVKIPSKSYLTLSINCKTPNKNFSKFNLYFKICDTNSNQRIGSSDMICCYLLILLNKKINYILF